MRELIFLSVRLSEFAHLPHDSHGTCFPPQDDLLNIADDWATRARKEGLLSRAEPRVIAARYARYVYSLCPVRATVEHPIER